MSRLEKLHKLLAADPDDVELHYMVAMEHRSLGALDQALAKLEDCLRLNPQHTPSFFQMGSIHIACGRMAEAREALTRGIHQARQTGDDHAAAEMQELLGSLGK